MTEFEATLVLRRDFPNVPQRTLANVLNAEVAPEGPREAFGIAYDDLSVTDQLEVDDAWDVAALGRNASNCPGWATIYGRIRRADAKLKAEALGPIPV